MENDKLAEECRAEAADMKKLYHKGYQRAQDLLNAAADRLDEQDKEIARLKEENTRLGLATQHHGESNVFPGLMEKKEFG